MVKLTMNFGCQLEVSGTFDGEKIPDYVVVKFDSNNNAIRLDSVKFAVHINTVWRDLSHSSRPKLLAELKAAKDAYDEASPIKKDAADKIKAYILASQGRPKTDSDIFDVFDSAFDFLDVPINEHAGFIQTKQ